MALIITDAVLLDARYRRCQLLERLLCHCLVIRLLSEDIEVIPEAALVLVKVGGRVGSIISVAPFRRGKIPDRGLGRSGRASSSMNGWSLGPE